VIFRNCYDHTNDLSRFVTFTDSRSMPFHWILHLIYKVRRTTLLIVTFSFAPYFVSSYLPPFVRSVSNRSWRFFAPFSSLSTASFWHPSSALLANTTLNSPSFGRMGFRWGIFTNNLQSLQLRSRDSARFRLVKRLDLSSCLNILKYVLWPYADR